MAAANQPPVVYLDVVGTLPAVPLLLPLTVTLYGHFYEYN